MAVLKQRVLRYVDFALDFTCNQHCEHCFARSYDVQKEKGRGNLKRDDYQRTIQEAISLGAISISIQGGEPFALMKELREFLNCIPVYKCLVSIKSNGTLITPERAQEVRSKGVDIVTISVDSAIDKEHDEFRGMKGALEKTKIGIENCLQAGLKVIVACTLCHQNIGSQGILDLIEFTKSKGLMLFFIKAAPSGNWSGRKDVLLTDRDQEWIEEILRTHLHCRTDFEANYWENGCGAWQEILYISQYGDVMSCPFIQVSFGNIQKNSLGKIWHDGFQHPYFQTKAKICQIADSGPFLDQYLEATEGKEKMPISVEEFNTFKRRS